MSLESWKLLFEIVGIVAVGVTFVAGSAALIAGNILNKRQAAQLRQFDDGLTAAKTELSKQQERAANADARVAGLETAAADAKSEMAKQQIRAAHAEKDLLELRERIKPRSLTAEQRQELVRLLRESPHKGAIDMGCPINSDESCAFAQSFRDVLNEAGWTVPNFGLLPAAGGLVGIIIMVHSVEAPPARSVALQRALLSIGLGGTVSANNAVPADSVTLIIGVKPPN